MDHHFSSKYRTWVVSVTEMQDRVIVAIVCSRYGEFGDEEEFKKSIYSVINKYGNDPRPLQMTNQHSGQRITIGGDEFCGIAFVDERKDIN